MIAPFFKRTLCKFYVEGRCERGDECTWSHNEESQVFPRPLLALRANQAVPTEKRTLCKFFMQGRCEMGDSCTWAHGEEDIGAPIGGPLAEVEYVEEEFEEAFPEEEDLQEQLVKKILCKFWQEGRCKNSVSCTWAHGEHELGKPRVPETTIISTSIPARAPTASGKIVALRAVPEFSLERTRLSAVSTSALRPFNTRWSTEPTAIVRRTICKFWQEGRCEKLADDCSWAHGEQEIGTIKRGVVTNPRQACKFFEAGTCLRGSECAFAHVEDAPQPLERVKRSRLV